MCQSDTKAMLGAGFPCALSSSSQREGDSTRGFLLSPNGFIHPHPPSQIQHHNSCVTIPSISKQPNTACASENSRGNSGVRGPGVGPAP